MRKTHDFHAAASFPRLGGVGAVQYNQTFLEGQNDFLSNEGVHISRVIRNHGLHQFFLCSPRNVGGPDERVFARGPNSRPVKIRHTSIESPRPCVAGMIRRLARTLVVLAVAFTAVAALAQHAQTIAQIRVIGNRRMKAG